ncbi:TetR/AcrR family transcriptional regulator [Mycolicibacterium hippocampi]|uniref:TetR family transcriptional regulator n=1 Tax=Mycolicibacterium hippocampi TaxID=659824 RepID=A0A7I9ZW19_9MYCO|nr:TetR family transcriptional regulator [Mycolicibacterium hippocampi]GFH04936.1 TetR family transcriptional regulator [Mycolicibacterium hippocampi]
MGSANRQAAERELKSIEHSAPRTRVLDAALRLFAEFGVSGTSLQMIASSVGITKAAVYHQFRTKEEIVIAVTERELSRLIPALERAEAEDDLSLGRDELLIEVISMAVRDRRLVRTLQFDPVVVRLLAEHPPFQQFMARLYGVLLRDAGDDVLIEAAMLSGAISSGVMHPLVADVDDDTLRTRLIDVSRRLLGIVPASRPPN